MLVINKTPAAACSQGAPAPLVRHFLALYELPAALAWHRVDSDDKKPCFLGVPEKVVWRDTSQHAVLTPMPSVLILPTSGLFQHPSAPARAALAAFSSAGTAGDFPHSHPCLAFSISGPHCGFGPQRKGTPSQCTSLRPEV